VEFAVCDYAHRSFDQICAELGGQPTRVIQSATNALPIRVRAESGPLLMLAPAMAAVHVTWRTPSRRLWLTAELRILGVNRGADSITELLLVGEATPVRADRAELLQWAHGLLAELADHPVPVPAPLSPTGNAYSRLLAQELVRHGG